MEAVDRQIIAAPTLVKELPMPLKRMVGDLSDRDKGVNRLESCQKLKRKETTWVRVPMKSVIYKFRPDETRPGRRRREKAGGSRSIVANRAPAKTGGSRLHWIQHRRIIALAG